MIEDFNDPFELVFGIDTATALDTIKRECEENPTLIDAWIHLLDEHNIDHDKNSPENIVQKITEFQINDFGKVSKEIKEGWNEKMGIICLSELPDVIQMWAHYTENHRGIVIGIEESEFMNKETLVTVCYRDKMTLFPVTAIPDKLDQYEKYFLDVIRGKESNWHYEKEIRIYVDLDEKDAVGKHYCKIPPSSIKEIYLGLRSHETTEIIAKSIKQREEYKHLKIFKMMKHKSVYKLVPEEIKNG